MTPAEFAASILKSLFHEFARSLPIPKLPPGDELDDKSANLEFCFVEDELTGLNLVTVGWIVVAIVIGIGLTSYVRAWCDI